MPRSKLKVIVAGNVTLDVLCYPVNDVPRHESISFERAFVGPGGCASNTAIVLASLGVPTGIVACIGNDEAAQIARRTWQAYGVDARFVEAVAAQTAVSVGLIDSEFQPRFIHTSGANAMLTPERLKPTAYAQAGAKWLHLGGYFVLPGLAQAGLAAVFQKVRALGMATSLDVVTSPAMDDPAPLWPVLPHVDVFFCNLHEARRLTGARTAPEAAAFLKKRGAKTVVVKLGAEGAFVQSADFGGIVSAPSVEVADTTGAGDAFAAGYIAAALEGAPPREATIYGNKIGAQAVTALGATAAFQVNAEAQRARKTTDYTD